MAVFIMSCSNVLVTQKQVDKITEILEGSFVVTQDWQTKKPKVSTELSHSDWVKFAPFSAREYADMMLRHEEALAKAKD